MSVYFSDCVGGLHNATLRCGCICVASISSGVLGPLTPVDPCFLQVHQLEKHGSLSHGSISNRLALPSGCLSIVTCKFRLTLCACASKLRPRGVC